MIVCSCNVLSEAQIRSVIASAAPRPRMSYIYDSLGCAAKCGRCAHTIKVMFDEIKRCQSEPGNLVLYSPFSEFARELRLTLIATYRVGCVVKLPHSRCRLWVLVA